MDTKELLDLYHRLRERYERLSVEIDLLEVILVDMEKKLPDSATEDLELE